eukprot:XP_011667148.1 PREDICTED: macrophage mannose receptor 1-like [Strongylocentrotus purpuratus]
MVQTIPKLIPISTGGGQCPTRTGTRGIPAGHKVCRFPDCKDVCENGWCEETMKSYKCHCLTGFRGRHCDERAGPAPTADKMTKSTTDLMITMTSQATSTTADSSYQELSGWFEGSLYCYFSEKKVTFTQAMTNCRNIDNVTGQSDLVSIHSQKEMDFVLSICKDLNASLLQPCYEESPWIGLYQPDTYGPFIWSDGTSVSYTAWAPGQPDHYYGNSEDCTHIFNKRSTWNDYSCSAHMSYVCKLRCPKLWRFFQGSCYRHFREEVNYTQAMANCRKIDMMNAGQSDLISIHSQEEMDFIISTSEVQGNNNDPRWIGLYQPDPNDRFVWSDGTDVSYTAWYQGQPNNRLGVEDCVHILRYKSGRELWNDIDCTMNFTYICKFNPKI